MPHNALQTQFSESIRTAPDDAPIIADIAEHSAAAKERFAVYQNNISITQTAALAETFNTVEALVGEEFFTAIAREYAKQHPPHSMNLNDYGGQFPEFIAAFPHAASLPYLADVARFDRAWHQSFFAMNEPALSHDDIAAMDFSDADSLHLTPASHMQLLSLDYPAHELWRYCIQTARGDAAAEPDIIKGRYPILLWREGVRVKYSLESKASFAAYLALSHGDSLENIIAAAIEKDDQFPVSQWLQMLFSRAILIHSQLNE